VVAHVPRLARRSRRVASVCTGTSVPAAAGLLDGRRATTHWAFAAAIAARCPSVTIDPDPIYILDGSISTTAGVTAALHLTPAFIEEDHGADLVRQTARSLVTYLHRPGSQAQMSMHVDAPPPAHHEVRTIVDHVLRTPDGDLSTAALARRGSANAISPACSWPSAVIPERRHADAGACAAIQVVQARVRAASAATPSSSIGAAT
jgi:transcriptional regulator GlxA family with amidase domain